MLDDGVEPDKYTFVSLFKACGTIQDLQLGRKLHADARRKGITFDVFVCNTLVSMYGKCGAIIEAEEVFCAMSDRTIVSWNAMLSAYVELEQGERALLLYRQMQNEGENVNELTFVLAVQACGSSVEQEASHLVTGQPTENWSLQIARALHVDAHRKGYTSDTLVGNTLVNIYGKCGAISEAENVFVQIYDCNVVSWTAVICTYMECGEGEKALQLFAYMLKEGVVPNQLTYMVALQACGTLIEKQEYSIREERSSLTMIFRILQALHADSHGQGYTSDALVGNTLISVYGKCGAIVEAEALYHGLSSHNVVSCNVMFSAYIEQGEVHKASQFYKQVQVKHADVDEVTLICMLKLSSEIGSREVCSNVHFSIVSAGYDSSSSVSATLIHAYGSCGSSIDAQIICYELCDPDRVLWNACIAGYAGEGNHLATLHILEKSKAEGLQPDKVSLTSVLSACCHTGLIMEGLEYFESLCVDCGITPDLQHYGILIDLLGRAGSFARIENLLRNLTMQADVGIWLCLLGACRTHGNLGLADFSFQNAVRLLPEEAVAYVLISNIYEYFGEQHLEVESLD